MLRLTKKSSASKFRPKAKTWAPDAVLKSIASTYNRNPMEQNPMVPLNSKLVNYNLVNRHSISLSSQKGIIDVTKNAEISGQEYAESLGSNLDRFFEERAFSGVSPLPGFKTSPRSADEPNLPYPGHTGRYQSGEPYFSSKAEDGKYMSHPTNYERLLKSREQGTAKRSQLKSEESLKAALHYRSTVQAVELIFSEEYRSKPLVTIEDPLVRTNLPLDDFTPQSAYEPFQKTVIVKDETTGLPVTQFPNELLYQTVEMFLHKMNPYIWEMHNQKRFEDTAQSYRKLQYDIYSLRAAFRNQESLLTENKVLPWRRLVGGKMLYISEEKNTEYYTYSHSELLDYCREIFNIIENKDPENFANKMSEEEKLRFDSLQMQVEACALDFLNENQIAARKIEQKAENEKFISKIKEKKFDITTYEALLNIHPKTLHLKSSEYVNEIVLKSMIENSGLKPRLQTYNTLLELNPTFPERSTLFENMKRDGIEPSIYSYALLYESIFDLLASFNTDPRNREYNVIYNEDFKAILDKFWIEFSKKRFLRSPDLRDTTALYRMMVFVGSHYIHDMINRSSTIWRQSNNVNSESENTKIEEPSFTKLVNSDLPLALDESNRILNMFKSYQHSEFVAPFLQPSFFQMYMEISIAHITNILIPKIDLADELLQKPEYKSNFEARELLETYIKSYKDQILEVYTESTKYTSNALLSRDELTVRDVLYRYVNGHPATIGLLTPTFLKISDFLGVDVFFNDYKLDTMISNSYKASIPILMATKNTEDDGTNKEAVLPKHTAKTIFLMLKDFFKISAVYLTKNTDASIENMKELRSQILDKKIKNSDELAERYNQIGTINEDVQDIGACLKALDKTIRVLSIMQIESAISKKGANEKSESLLMLEYINQLALAGEFEKGLELLNDFALESRSLVNKKEKVAPLLDLRTHGLGYYFASILLYAPVNEPEHLQKLLELAEKINERHTRDIQSNKSPYNIIVTRSAAEDLRRKYILKEQYNKILDSLIDETDYHQGQ